MKKEIFIGIFMLILVVGCIQQKQEEQPPTICDEEEITICDDKGVCSCIKEKPQEQPQEPERKQPISTLVLVNRTKYVQGGKPELDIASIYFTQKAEKSYQIDINADKKVNVEVMTNRDCLLKEQEKQYQKISSNDGDKFSIINDKTPIENNDLCVKIKAIDEGEIKIGVVVTELSY